MPGNLAGVAAVERAASLLEAFTDRDFSLSLGELSRRVELDKSTVLRIARSLAKHGLLVRNEDGSWRLGPKLMKLGNIYQSTFRASDIIEPLLAQLVDQTGESAAVYAREGDERVCLFRHDSHQSIRHSARVGDTMPLDLGAPGRVILAFNGKTGSVYDEIRHKGFYATFGERDPQVASLAVPIFRDGDKLFGSLALTGPPARFTEEAIKRNLETLQMAARRLSAAMGGEPG
ncbi:IclR family transcriptional regulator [Rhizobium bangladeshense]|uniref:IclR family transcriptional regulator n=1 Tax=Rhizobium bangladeshense TaxID=1138189 RepID=UPI001C8302F0|nr:IclR family transcriptional regulator [Rhizobium bangladeshense]MBX4892083.1 IclR family transcriptional regulator [Rhizobium bangladeshense]MBX4913972.1 IclR family transcriptional regulator [Rhizobium bangladeshense]MBX4919726.1 IclR family transcriptional regulator [Rhizobium bangladeshense]